MGGTLISLLTGLQISFLGGSFWASFLNKINPFSAVWISISFNSCHCVFTSGSLYAFLPVNISELWFQDSGKQRTTHTTPQTPPPPPPPQPRNSQAAVRSGNTPGESTTCKFSSSSCGRQSRVRHGLCPRDTMRTSACPPVCEAVQIHGCCCPLCCRASCIISSVKIVALPTFRIFLCNNYLLPWIEFCGVSFFFLCFFE